MRVFPTPPGPVTVTSRAVPSNPSSTASSRWRPTKPVTSAGSSPGSRRINPRVIVPSLDVQHGQRITGFPGDSCPRGRLGPGRLSGPGGRSVAVEHLGLVLVLFLFHAVVVPSGLTTRVQPHRASILVIVNVPRLTTITRGASTGRRGRH